VLASSKSCTQIGDLLSGYQLCAATEGKSTSAIAIVTNSIRYLSDFLSTNSLKQRNLRGVVVGSVSLTYLITI